MQKYILKKKNQQIKINNFFFYFPSLLYKSVVKALDWLYVKVNDPKKKLNRELLQRDIYFLFN